MSITETAPRDPARRLHGVWAWDGQRVLLVAANIVGVLCIVTSLVGWGGLGDDALLDGLAFESLIVLSTALFIRSALAQPGRWRRPLPPRPRTAPDIRESPYKSRAPVRCPIR